MRRRMLWIVPLVCLGVAALAWRLWRGIGVQELVTPAEPAAPATSAASTALADSEASAGRTRAALKAESDSQSAAAPLPANDPLHGRLLDERTGEAVPDFPLGLRGAEEEEPEELVTDADGRFRSRKPRTPGAFAFEWSDPDAHSTNYMPTERTLDTLASEHEFRLLVGPTYELDLRLPAGLVLPGDLHARLANATERDVVSGAESARTPVRAAPDRRSAFEWVRFHPDQVAGASSAGPWFLDVTSEDGVWSGGAQVRSIVGRYSEVVAIDLLAHAALRGSVHDEHHRPVETAWVRIEREDGSERHAHWYLTGGEYRLCALAPGRWRVEIDSDEHPTHSALLDLLAGRESVHDVTLPGFTAAGAVRGIVTSATGQWHGEGLVALWGHDGTKSNRRSATKWVEESGRWVHRFAFEDIPAGTYKLEWVARGCPFEVRPAPAQLVSIPSEGLELRIQDDAPVGQLVFRAHEAGSGKELPTFDLWWAPLEGWANWKRGVATGEVVIESWPLERELLWALRAPGGALVAGDSRSFVRAGARLLADVAVDAGWGVQFFVEDEQHNYLAGIRFAFDGAEVPPSGTHGRLPVSLPRRPTRVEVLTPGWRIVSGGIDAATGDVNDENWWALALTLQRTPR